MRPGFTIIEALFAAGFFAIIASGVTIAIIQSLNASRLATEQTIALQYAREGLEATRSIRNQSFASLATTTATGLSVNGGGLWQFSGTSTTFDVFTRTISVATVQRDGSGNIVTSSGTTDANTKKITATVSWPFTSAQTKSIDLTTYLTNWKISGASGVLVYGDGGTTLDTIKYRTFDGSTWSAAASAADVDGATTNKAVRAAQIYASATRNEKILITRHFNGTSQFIYAQVYNGDTGTWGNVLLLSSWTANTFLDVQNFSGTYLANGDFMIVFSDNTIIPKMITWNGTAWSGTTSLTTLGTGNIPNYIITKSRPGTNEVMAAFFTQGSDTITEYYSGATWSAITSHATAAPLNTQQMADFDWSPNNLLKGALVYSDAGADKSLDIKIWTADGVGGGSWSTVVNSTNQANNLGSMSVVGRPGANEFVACDKGARNPPRIICYKSDFTPTWTNPTNQTLVTGSDAGVQRSFDLAFEAIAGDPGLAVYSDTTLIPKLKKYSASGASFDSVATVLPTLGGAVKTVRLIPEKQSDDILILLTDNNLDLYSIFWNGSATTLYTTPADFTLVTQGVNGSATTDFWYDFAWDQ